jgi:hypothetical protein
VPDWAWPTDDHGQRGIHAAPAGFDTRARHSVARTSRSVFKRRGEVLRSGHRKPRTGARAEHPIRARIHRAGNYGASRAPDHRELDRSLARSSDTASAPAQYGNVTDGREAGRS